jgi:hypothetical protein
MRPKFWRPDARTPKSILKASDLLMEIKALSQTYREKYPEQKPVCHNYAEARADILALCGMVESAYVEYRRANRSRDRRRKKIRRRRTRR